MCKKFTLSLVWKRSISTQLVAVLDSKTVSHAGTKHPGTAPKQCFALAPCVYLEEPVVTVRGLHLRKGYFFWRIWNEVGMSDGF